RPRAQARRADRGPEQDQAHRHPHLAPHPLRHRHRCQRPAEDGPWCQPRDPRPLDHVHLRGGHAGPGLAPRALLRPRARRPTRHGATTPQTMDPGATPETPPPSTISTSAGPMPPQACPHEHSHAPERAGRPATVDLGHKIETTEAPEWTRRYHSIDPNEKAFGGRVEIEFEDGSTLVDEIAVADAHPLGARPFARANYVEKFNTLAEGIVSDSEQARFLDL